MTAVYSDQELTSWILSGTQEAHDRALKHLYKTYYPSIQTLILKNKGDDTDAEDVFQEALVVLYHHIKEKRFRGNAAVKTYLYAIARNIWLKELRKRSYQLSIEIDTEAYTELEDGVEMENEKKIHLLKTLINKLGKGCQEILIDYYYAKCSMKEIMVKLGLGSEQAAKNKKYRCMQQLIVLCQQNGLSKN